MSNDRDLEGNRALVTGSTSGIGRATAELLARHGADVIVQGRDARRGQAVAESILREGGKARFIAADLAVPEQIDSLVEMAEPVDILVNNAGTSWFGPTPNLDAAGLDRLLAANIRAPYLRVAAIAPGMAARGGGSIINIGSQAGEIGMPGGAAYGATKGALDAMTRSWAAEYSPAGVRINTVASGPVYTSIQPPEITKAVGDGTIMGRAAQPNEIAEVVVFLASSRASYVTGAVVAADGGRSAI
ncbi:MAG TPA: SDR family oxidoreductase [Pseudonocardia sp.]